VARCHGYGDVVNESNDHLRQNAGRAFITAHKWLLVIDEPLTKKQTPVAGWRRIAHACTRQPIVNLGTKDLLVGQKSLSNRSSMVDSSSLEMQDKADLQSLI